MKVVELACEPLSVPLVEPFVIATATMTHTRAALVRATVEGRGGERVVGLGEAAALPPVTTEDQPELLSTLTAAGPAVRGREFDLGSLESLLDSLGLGLVARAAVECALLDAAARHALLPLHRLLGSVGEPTPLETDITLPIAEPGHLGRLAQGYAARGFRAFKIKVGKSLEDDRAVLAAVARAVPGAHVRLDANEGHTADEALSLLDTARALALVVECFEQPCARAKPEAMARVTSEGGVPVVADESCRSLADLEGIASDRIAHAVNLKLVKLGGLGRTLAVGRRARALGLGLMAGAMVETRLGLSAMAHVVAALGGVDWLDLDTAFLLASDPFVGGYRSHGARLELLAAAGSGVELA